jgi:hypothetical protein
MRRALIIVTLMCTLGFARSAQATVISFEATDLIDQIAGEDLWLYRYLVSDRDFLAFQGFSTYFDPAFYDLESDQNPNPQVNADWDVLILDTDLGLPDGGIYDALALTDHASLADPFVVTFVWLGTGAPGSQPFTINQFDAEGNISFIEEGQTTPARPVPEPSTLLLISTAAAALGARRRRRAH